MPLTGDVARFGVIRNEMLSLARGDGAAQKKLLAGVKQQVTLLLKTEFSSSVDPSGTEWQRTVRGRPALVSKKLPQAFELELVDGAVRGVGKSKRDLLLAHQEGATFKARNVAAQKQYLTFDKRGRLIKSKRALNKQGEARRGVHQTFARAHTVGERELVARPIVPLGGPLPKNWDAAVRAGLLVGMQWWIERVSR